MRVNWTQLLSGLVLLLVGALLYLSSRHSESVSLFRILDITYIPLNIENAWARLLINSTPAFIHVLAFSCITYSLVKVQSISNLLNVVIFWVTLNLIAEIGQLAGKFDVATCNNAENIFSLYFCNGTFDLNDLLFTLASGVMSLIFLTSTRGDL